MSDEWIKFIDSSFEEKTIIHDIYKIRMFLFLKWYDTWINKK